MDATHISEQNCGLGMVHLHLPASSWDDFGLVGHNGELYLLDDLHPGPAGKTNLTYSHDVFINSTSRLGNPTGEHTRVHSESETP